MSESAPRGGHFRDGIGASRESSAIRRADQEAPRRAITRVPEPGLKASTGWAEPTPLRTTAQARQLEDNAFMRTNTKRFLKEPGYGELYSAVASALKILFELIGHTNIL